MQGTEGRKDARFGCCDFITHSAWWPHGDPYFKAGVVLKYRPVPRAITDGIP